MQGKLSIQSQLEQNGADGDENMPSWPLALYWELASLPQTGFFFRFGSADAMILDKIFWIMTENLGASKIQGKNAY